MRDSNTEENKNDKDQKVPFLGEKITHTETVKTKSSLFGTKQSYKLSGIGIILLAVLGSICILVAIFCVPGSRDGDSQPWFSIAGNYSLDSYEGNYSDFLKAIGVPWMALPAVLVSPEDYSVKLIEGGLDTVTVTAFTTTHMEYYFNESFIMEYGEDMGQLSNVCNQLQWNIINCKSEETEKGWKLETTQTFSEEGMVEERILVDKNIYVKRYFKKVNPNEKLIGMTSTTTTITTTTTTTSTTSTTVSSTTTEDVNGDFSMLEGWENWR